VARSSLALLGVTHLEHVRKRSLLRILAKVTVRLRMEILVE
jgi:hypothetical protein